jgi:hypothetical protein
MTKYKLTFKIHHAFNVYQVALIVQLLQYASHVKLDTTTTQMLILALNVFLTVVNALDLMLIIVKLVNLVSSYWLIRVSLTVGMEDSLTNF